MPLLVAHVLIVLAAAFVLAFSVLSAVLAYRSPIKHRIWWAFVCLLAAPVTTMNWSTGVVGTRLMSIQVFGVGAMKPRETAPWFLSVGFPSGAIMFRSRRKRLILARRPLLPEDQIP